MIRSCQKPVIYTSGKMQSLNSLELKSQYEGFPFETLRCSFEGYQSGWGTPSPTHVRKLNAVDRAMLCIMLDDNSGNYFNNVVKGTHSFVDLGTLTWESLGDSVFCATISDIKQSKYTAFNLSISGYTKQSTPYTDWGELDNVFGTQNNSSLVYFKNTSIESASDFTDAMSGVYGIYELAVATFPSFTEEQFNGLCGAFGTDGDRYIFNFGQQIYTGTVDFVHGSVYATHLLVDLGSLEWIRNTQYTNPLFLATLPNAKESSDFSVKSNIQAEIFNTYAVREMNTEGVDYAIGLGYYYSSTYNLCIIDSDYSDATAFKTAMSGKYIAYQLATAIYIPFGGINVLSSSTGVAIASLAGPFIWDIKVGYK